ncbi:BTAD domain-containing putative transcriptional regulator [Raoultibacter phocaeensis]|uniref:BTAD domain-containing putative transcriptional regulator n=1 Tax=Raoultibacter phocaeensis TaxID=2479841 RepID=UPI00111A0D94|nr:BTAD domain-containing putative transcriptional regulator [Raoultibacter phocaeensis]
MADFIMNSACNGCKPKHLRGRRHYQRTGLLSRMMQKRDVGRFLIAPSGFGKTALACAYAESIFEFRNVFWLDAQSPCFLRDVDRGTLASSLTARTRTSSLVVIEDVPRLTAERAESMSACIDKLLERGWEVVVSMVPMHRALADRQPDGVRICSEDFMVTEDELRSIASESGVQFDSRTLFAAGGVPGLVWGGPKAPLRMLRAAVADAAPTDLLFALFAITSLGSGSIEDVEVFTGSLKSDTRALLERGYLFAGLDERRGHFESYPFSVEDIVRAFSPCLGRIAAASSFADANALAARLADALMARGQSERACLLVDGCCNADKRISWLSSRSAELTEAGCLLAAHRLFESKALRLNAQTAQAFVQEAWRLAALDDIRAALALCERVIGCAGAPDVERGQAVLLAARFAEAEVRAHALAALKGVSSAGGRKPESRSEAIRGALNSERQRWRALAWAHLWLCEDARAVFDLCALVAERGLAGAVETTLLLWSVQALVGAGPCACGSLTEAEASRVLGIVGDYLRMCEQGSVCGLAEALLLDAWDQAKALGRSEEPYPRLAVLRASAQAVQLWLFSQRSAFERTKHTAVPAPKSAARGTVSAKTVSAFGMDRSIRDADAAARSAVPELSIRLFGGLEASIGGAEVDPSLFRRQKVKTLLALLTLNQGKELLRERLSEILWPMSSPATAKRNFYSTWSFLRKALSLPGGECPYLIRLQHSCKLDARLVASDVAEFDLLCNRLLFDPPDVEAWSGIYSRLDELYRGDLLPCEGRNEFIVRQREEYRARLIDALVAASMRLFEQGGLQAALWFAHAAVRKDATREDAYIALMQAQIAMGQRTAALDTYFKCKRYLSTELGIDPSKRALLLYGSIIEEEPSLKSFVPKG